MLVDIVVKCKITGMNIDNEKNIRDVIWDLIEEGTINLNEHVDDLDVEEY